MSVIFICKEKEHSITLPDVWVLGVRLCETTASGQEEWVDLINEFNVLLVLVHFWMWNELLEERCEDFWISKIKL